MVDIRKQQVSVAAEREYIFICAWYRKRDREIGDFSDFYCTLNEYFRSSRRFRECVLDNHKVRATRNYDFMQVL